MKCALERDGLQAVRPLLEKLEASAPAVGPLDTWWAPSWCRATKIRRMIGSPSWG